jgi:hypothetical protein
LAVGIEDRTLHIKANKLFAMRQLTVANRRFGSSTAAPTMSGSGLVISWKEGSTLANGFWPQWRLESTAIIKASGKPRRPSVSKVLNSLGSYGYQGCCTLTAFSFQDAGNVNLAGGEIFVFAGGDVLNLCCAAPSDVVGTARISSTPLPAALPLFATGLGGLGLLGWRRKRKAQAVAA